MKIPVKIFKKYTQAGPNYQCYPTTLAFQECIKQEAVIEKIHGLKESTINLQLHVPLCRDPDYHSTTHQIQLANSDQLKTYIACLKKEISIYKRYINKVKVAEIHLSGNEVSLLDSSVFNQIIDCLAETFEINLKQTNLSIDINARLLDSAQLVTLKNIGFSSLKISTLNFDYKLQTSLKSHQSYQQTEQLIRDAKHLDFEAINVELLYGLPGESINGILIVYVQ